MPEKNPQDPALPEKQLRDERAPFLRDGTVTVRRKKDRTREQLEAAVRQRYARGAEDEVTETEIDEEKGRAEESDVIELAFSSEEPVERWDWERQESYLEILSHEPNGIDLDYARDGLPLFVNHSSWDMVGLVERVRLDSDKRLRGVPRFSRSVRGQEIKQDMDDEIRTKVSVGYDYDRNDYTEETVGGRKVRRYRWRPLEVSSVPIPADYTVGVGRNARPGARRPESPPGVPAAKAKENPMPEQGALAIEAGGARAEVASDHKEIAALAKQHGLTERLPEWIETGSSLDQVRKDILEHHRTKSAAAITRGGGDGPVLDLSTKDERRYSFARAIQSAVSGERSFEREVSDELYKKLGKRKSRDTALLLPTEILGRAMHARTMAVANTAAGSALRFDEYGGFLGLLRNRMYVAKFGAQLLSGLQGDLSFVTQPSSNTWQWGAETANPTATDFGTGIKTMAPKNGAAITKYTRQLLAQSVESIEGLVQEDLLSIAALAIDRAAIIAGGGSAPVGILGTTGIGAVTLGTAGGAPTYGTFVDLGSEIAVDNADAENMKYLTTVRAAGLLQKTQQFSGTNGVPIWTWGPDGLGRVNGHVAARTNQVPNDGTKGSNTGVLHAAIFGDWSSLIIGEWGAVEILVDPYSSKMALIEVGVHAMVDVLLRYPEKFAACTDMVIT